MGNCLGRLCAHLPVNQPRIHNISQRCVCVHGGWGGVGWGGAHLIQIVYDVPNSPSAICLNMAHVILIFHVYDETTIFTSKQFKFREMPRKFAFDKCHLHRNYFI